MSPHSPSVVSHAPRSSDVVIAVLTYKRPEPLRTCITALQNLDVPTGVQASILVIDNDPDRSVVDASEAWRSVSHNLPLTIVHEPRRGIPAARNRALDTATDAGADLMCFLDDDEYPDDDWLAELLRCRKETGAELIGGPVFVADPPSSLGPWKHFINRSLQARARRTMARTGQRFRTGGRFTVVTNNWMCDLAWLARSAVRFDDDLEVTGGSDTVFFHDAVKAGCTPVWCESACVREVMEPARLSLAYQFRRAYSQSINHYRFKHLEKSGFHRLAVAIHAVLRLTTGTLLLLVPVYGIASPVIAVRSIGWAIGRWRALAGGESRLYSR